MPVGTRGTVRALTAAAVAELGYEVFLANSYHLMLRPGAEKVAGFGGLHAFSGWNGHLLTDSGVFQVFSLAPAVDDDGVTFRSTYDGSLHRMTPEDAVRVQELLGADIQMVLDVCTSLPASREALQVALDRTLSWADRARRAQTRSDQAQFGIVQGGTEPDLRAESAHRTVALDFDGYGIGGLSVGETRPEMLRALDATLPELPPDRPRYLMGVGDPVSLIEAVARGVDMFDCVLPTRLGRHGTALTADGRVHLRNARWAEDRGPIEESCGCPTCVQWSRGFLRHLFSVGEPAASAMVSLHNLAWVRSLMVRMREAIVGGSLSDLRLEVAERWNTAPGVPGSGG